MIKQFLAIHCIFVFSVTAMAQTDGHLDESYQTYPGISGNISKILIQPDDKALVSGAITSYLGGSYQRKLIRLGTNGSLDIQYNNSEIIGKVRDFKLTQGGKIVVVGNATLTGSGRSVVQLMSNGLVDDNFHQVNTDNFVKSVDIQSDGRIVAGGTFSIIDDNTYHKVVRLLSSGQVDVSFTGPSELADTSADVTVVKIQPDEKILLAGSFLVNGTSGIVRLNTDGSIDYTFDAGIGGNGIEDMELQPDGKIIVAGSFTSFAGVSVGRILRLNSNGSLDETFNPGGTGFNRWVFDIALTPNGKIVVGGNYFSEYNSIPIGKGVARLNSNGTLDDSFDTGIGFSTEPNVNAVGVEANGGVIAGGVNIEGYDGTQTGQLIRIHGSLTDVNELGLSSVGVSPNPSSGLFEVLIPEMAESIHVSIYDMMGKEVHSSDHKGALEVDLSNQANGIYTMKIISEAGSFSQKLMKQ